MNEQDQRAATKKGDRMAKAKPGNWVDSVTTRVTCYACGLPVTQDRRTHTQLEKRIRELKDALTWYADEGNYLTDDNGCFVASAWCYNRLGSKARAVLSKEPSEEPSECFGKS